MKYAIQQYKTGTVKVFKICTKVKNLGTEALILEFLNLSLVRTVTTDLLLRFKSDLLLHWRIEMQLN